MKATIPAEKPFLRLAVGRTFALPNSGIVVWTEKNAVVCLLCQGIPSRSWFTREPGLGELGFFLIVCS